MSLQDITNKILADAQAEADKIIQANKAETEKMADQKDKEIAQAVQAIERKGREKEARLIEQSEFKIRTIKKNALLQVKQELIDQAFAVAKKNLTGLDDIAFITLMVNLLKDAPRLDKAKIIASTKRKNQISKAMKRTRISYKFSAEKLPPGQEGFILSSKTIEVNNTIDSLVKHKREGLEADVVKVLFG